MKKLLAVMLMTFFLSPIIVISTEEKPEFPKEVIHELNQSALSKVTYYDVIPQNPNVYYETYSYLDADLNQLGHLISPNTAFSISKLMINSSGKAIFQLTDGTYIEANKTIIYDDVLKNQMPVDLNFWTKAHFLAYNQPFVKGILPKETDIKAYDEVHASRLVQTQQGNYYYINNKVWISETDLSLSDNRMSKVQDMLTQKYNKSNYSIFVKQLDTQAVAGINADQLMYSASIAKLATLYYVQDKINNGQLVADKKLNYSDQVHHFDGAYDGSGSGKISKEADHKDYSVDELLKAVSQHSDNVATNILGYYIANKYDQKFYAHINAIAGMKWNMESRMLSSHAQTNLMEAIYYQNGQIISYLSATDFDDNRISKNISVPVAHKIGDAYENRHDVAIIYGKSPYILSVFTDNASYEDITQISDDVYSILK
ncbi:serine hydrolase [Streptococcus iniae]|uniref:serine hydrolase n=1 Tax=Streptococcus iniae TaxID=1346 RepID=UPI002B2DE4AF|nr:serine hydrolase [Streptococcus iniae]